MAGHLSGPTDTPWRLPGVQPVGCCVPALLNKPREFGLGSCDHAWRGHFFQKRSSDLLKA